MNYTEKPAFQNLGTWIKGSGDFAGELTLKFAAKVLETSSKEFGIDGGKINKLEIRLDSELLCNYDRGWDIKPNEEVRPLYENILAKFNKTEPPRQAKGLVHI